MYICYPAQQKAFFQKHLLLTLLSFFIIAVPAFSQPLSDHAKKVIGQKSYAALKAKARERGELKVIVQLNIPVKQLSAISKAEAVAQMDAISKAQGRVLQRLINHKVKHSHSYRYTPYMAMTVFTARLRDGRYPINPSRTSSQLK